MRCDVLFVILSVTLVSCDLVNIHVNLITVVLDFTIKDFNEIIFRLKKVDKNCF